MDDKKDRRMNERKDGRMNDRKDGGQEGGGMAAGMAVWMAARDSCLNSAPSARTTREILTHCFPWNVPIGNLLAECMCVTSIGFSKKLIASAIVFPIATAPTSLSFINASH